MTLKIKDVNNTCIIDICEDAISQDVLCEIKNALSSISHSKRVAVNLAGVTYIGNEFGHFLEEYNVALLNPELNIYILMFLLQYDKICDLFVCEDDFFSNRRSIVKRSFKLCS